MGRAWAYDVGVLLDCNTCYKALRARDARFDGRFFVGVSSTRIYCRPICTVRAPKRENCTFYASAAAAESAGFRPCLRCRPELAPGNASVDATRRIAQAAAAMIEDEALGGDGMDGLAARLGVTDRHLRRVFQSEFGVSPVEFAQTQRLLLSKRLLTDTRLPVTEVAFAAGFASLRRFNALFKARYRLTPREIRKSPGAAPASDSLRFELSYRPPYDWHAIADFLGARRVAGVEEVTGTFYRRTVALRPTGPCGWIEVSPHPGKTTLKVTVSSSLAKSIVPVLARTKHLFDLACQPLEVAQALGDLARKRPGLRVPGAFDCFEIAVRAILGQQISVAGAQTLAGRFASAFGTPLNTPFPALTTAFPAAERIAALDPPEIAKLGVLPARARTIQLLARAIANSEIRLAPEADAPRTIARLQEIPGVGKWTAQYIAMRALAWPDAFPHTDLGVLKALGGKSPQAALAAGEAWRPWRAYAVMQLWSEQSGSKEWRLRL